MKKIFLSLFLALSTFNLSIANDNEISRGVCAPCNPCVPSCVIAGAFQTGASSLYEPVILQNGCKYIITTEIVNQVTVYRVTFVTPFCSSVAVVASSLQGNVTVNDQDESGFVLGNISDGDTVYFVAAPTVSK